MRKPIIVAAVASLVGLAGVSHAFQSIATSAIYASADQRRAECIIGNVGTKDVTVDIGILNEAGKPLSTAGPCFVESNFVCSVFATIPSGAAVACTAAVGGGADKLRGTLVLYDANNNPLRSAQLR